MTTKTKQAAKPLQGQEPAATFTDALTSIENVLSPAGKPVLGLYVHALHIVLMRSLGEDPSFAPIKPHLLGAPAVLIEKPGLSQTELAEYLGKQRATIGLQVEQCLARGLVRRVASPDDKRRYQLYITAKGRAFIEAARRAVPDHEAQFARGLTAAERKTLRSLLRKMIAG